MGNAALRGCVTVRQYRERDKQGGLTFGPPLRRWGLMRGTGRPRQAASGIVASLMLGSSSAAVAQQAPPPATAATGHDDDRRATQPGAASRRAAGKTEGPAHVPPDASGIDLTTLETKDLDLLYFDPVQTYLTPYIAPGL